MGESKRKRGQQAEETRVLDALSAISHTRTSVPNQECVQFMLLRLDHAAVASSELGGLPRLCHDFIKEAVEVNEKSGGKGPVEAIMWELWPSGRQMASLCRTHDVLWPAFSMVCHERAGAHGYGVRVASFPSIPESYIEEAHSALSENVAKTVEQIQSGPTVRLTSLAGMGEFISIPKIDGDEARPGILAQILRILDGMASSRESLLKVHSLVQMDFDGYSEDPRQVWEVEQNIKLMEELDMHAPWWPWYSHPENAFVWFGALVAKGPTRVTKSMRVVFPVDAEATRDLLLARVGQTSAYLMCGGLDADRDIAPRLASSVKSFVEVIAYLRSIQAEVESGAEELAEPEESLRFEQEAAQIDALGGFKNKNARYIVVVDRSEVGRLVLSGIRERKFEVFPEAIDAEFHAWEKTDAPIAIATGVLGAPDGWDFVACNGSSEGIREAAMQAATKALHEKRSLASIMGVDAERKAQMTELVNDVAVRVASKAGLEFVKNASQGVDALAPTGLLDLAIEAGGVEVNFDNVQILDEKIFEKVMSLTMRAVSGLIDSSRDLTTLEQMELAQTVKLDAWRRDDGSLLLREQIPPHSEVIVPQGSWKLLDEAELAGYSDGMSSFVAEHPEVAESIAMSITQAAENRKRIRESFEERAVKAHSIVMIVGRSTGSMMALRRLVGEEKKLLAIADQWVESSIPFLLVWQSREGDCVTMPAKSDEELLEQALWQMMALGESAQTTGLVCTTDTSLDARALKVWKERGGLTFSPPARGH